MKRLTGSEEFTLHGKSAGITVLDYWAWPCSDLHDNTMRGVMAEFSVLDLDYWDFYVLPTSVLNDKAPDQKSIALSSLLKLEPVKTDFAGLAETISLVSSSRPL